MKKIKLISDYFVEDMTGGACLCDEEMYEVLKSKFKIEKIKSKNLKLRDLLEEDCHFLVSNFFHIHPEFLSYISENLEYSHYAHDYKFVQHTNPNLYENFLVPKSDLINLDFFKNSKMIFCQSDFQKNIYDKNITGKTVNLSGNYFSDKTLEILSSKTSIPKNGKTAIIDSPYPQKGVKESILYCKENNLEYEIISSKSNEEFVNILSAFSSLCFLPNTPETLCRVVVEAKMMGLEVITNDLVGAKHEPWFKLDARDLCDYFYNFKIESLKTISNIIQ